MTEKNNEQKFLDFYDQNITRIYRYIYFRVGSVQTAQDLASEAFLKIWQYLKEGKGIENLSAMTYQVCRNLIADYFRKKSNLPITLEEAADFVKHIEEFDLKSDQDLAIEDIKKALRYLREEYQEAIIWYYIDDFSIEDIAGITGKSQGAVRTLTSRAVKALRELIEAKNK